MGEDTDEGGQDTRLQEVAAELYGLRPDRFTAARTAAALQARDAGDTSLAAEVKGLRRPTVAAYVVNLLARDRAELVEQVVSLGEALRAAQANLQGDALRELSRQRRQLVAAVAQRGPRPRDRRGAERDRRRRPSGRGDPQRGDGHPGGSRRGHAAVCSPNR